MKVAFDIGPLDSGHKVRGIGSYVRSLFPFLRKIKVNNLKVFGVDFRRSNLKKFDILHFTYFEPFFLSLPTKKFSKIIVTIHDLIPLIYPEKYDPGFRGKINFWIQKFLLKNVDAVIVPTFTTKKDVIRFLNLDCKKIWVTYYAQANFFREINGSEKLREVRKKYNLPSKFVLYVGDINYNKNIPNLLEACRIAGRDLVICGKQALLIDEAVDSLKNLKGPRDYFRFLFNIPHPELFHLKDLAQKFDRQKNILRLGYVPDDDLVSIYNLATVYVQPSFYEGFGLPVLEAMACGCPVIISKTNALTEIASDNCLIADPNDPSDIAYKINQVFEDSDLRASLIRRGKKRASDFSWEKTAKKTIKVYKSFL